MKNLLIEIAAYDPATNSTQTLRMSSAMADATGVVVNNLSWLPCLTGWSPRKISLFDSTQGETTPIAISHGELGIILDTDLNNFAWSSYDFDGRACSIWIGDLGDAWGNYRQVFSGNSGIATRDDLALSIPLSGPENLLNVDLLSASYAGTGGAEGLPGLKGTLKPWCSGACQNVTPILIDQAKLIYQVHGYGAVQDISMVYELSGQVNATASATAADYAALAALTLAPGQWAKAPAVGMFRLGGEPSGAITADVVGAKDGAVNATTISTIVPHLLKTAGLAVGKIDAASFAAFSQTWNFYTTSQVEIGDVVRDALHQAGGYIYPDSAGVFRAGNFFSNSSPGTLKGDRSSLPLVEGWKQIASAQPAYRVKIGYDRCWTLDGEGAGNAILATKATAVAADDKATIALTALTGINGAIIPAQQLQADITQANQSASDVGITAAQNLAVVQSAVDDLEGDLSNLSLSVNADIQELNEEIVGISSSATPNLLDGGGFEDGLTGWVQSGTGSWIHVPNHQEWGTHVQRGTASGTVVLQKTTPALPNAPYTLSADIAFFATSGVAYLDMLFKDASGNTLLDTGQTILNPGTNFSTSDTNRKANKCTAVSPANTAQVACRFVLENPVGLSYAGIRRMKLERGDKATAFSSDASSYTAYQTAKGASTSAASLTSTVSTLGGTVSTTATSVTKLADAVANSSGNLLTNSDFAADISGWTTGGSMLTGVSFGRNLIGDAWRPAGENVLCISQENSTTTGYQESTTDVAVEEGKYYEISALCSTHRCTSELIIQWLDGSGGALAVPASYSGALAVASGTTAINSWTKRWVKAVAPSGAQKARIYFRKFSTIAGANPANSYALICRPQLCETTADAASPRPYSPAASKAALQRISGSLSTLTTVVAASSSPNILPNGGFENGSLGWTTRGAGPAWSIGSVSGYWGPIASTSHNPANGTTVWIESDNVPIFSNGWITASCDGLFRVTGGTGYSYLEINWIGSDGTTNVGLSASALRASTATQDFDYSGAGRDLYKVTALAPATAYYARIRLIANKTTGTATVAAFRQVKLEAGTVATPFSGEASARQTWTAYSGTAGQVASLETEVLTAGGRVQTALNAGTTNAGNIATINTSLRAASSPNLLPNGGFETAFKGWSALGPRADTWVSTKWAWGTQAYNSAAWTGGGGLNHAILQSDLIGLAGDGNIYTITGEVELAAGAGAYSYFEVNWYNSSGVFISGSGSTPRGPSAFSQDGSQRFANKTTVSAPAGAGSARVNLVVYAPDGVTVSSMAWRQVKLEFGPIATPYSGEATAYQTYNVVAGHDSSISSLNTEVMTSGGKVGVLQSSMTTVQGSVSTLQSKVMVGSGNLVPNSDFASGWSGWNVYGPNWASYGEGNYGRDLAGDGWRPVNEHNLSLHQIDGNTANWAQWHTNRIAVEASKYYEFSAYVAAHRATAGIRIEWYDGNDNFISTQYGNTNAVNSGGTMLANWTRCWLKGQAPANAARAVAIVYKDPTTAGQGDSYMWFARPCLREVDQYFASPSAYTASGNTASVEAINQAVLTADSTANAANGKANTALARAAVKLDVNGYVTGWEMNNNGQTGNMVINANSFAIKNPSGGARTEFENGAWKVFDANGVNRVQIGNLDV
ncbi:MAG: hypothetical protein ACSLE1_15685 [Sphingobium sp.]